MKYTLSLKTPAGELMRHECDTWTDALATYNEWTAQRTPGPASVLWLKRGQIYRRFRLDADYEGDRNITQPVAPDEKGPYKFENGYKRVSLLMPTNLHTALKQEATDTGKSFSETVLSRITTYELLIEDATP